MDPQIILILLLAVPVVLLFILRVNAVLVFLSLCLGAVLVQFVGPDAATISASFSPQAKGMLKSQSTVNLILQLLPVVLTTVFMIGSVKGKGRHFFNLLPAVGVSALLALLVVPLLPYSMTSAITTTSLWRELENLQTLIISVTTLLTLFYMWLQRPRRALEEHGHH